MEKYILIDKYVKSVYDISIDISVWKSILDRVVDNYENEELDERDLFSSIFAIYDFDKQTGGGHLKVYQSEKTKITTKNINEQKQSFFRWLINSAILKIYNSFEILLYSVILEEFFNEKSDNFGKEHMKTVNAEINKCFDINNLKKPNGGNNRHLIQYLKFKSVAVKEFMKKPVRVDLKSNWEQLFELISILRNIIAHNGMLIEKDTINAMKSQKSAKDVFERYFATSLKIEELIVLDPKQDQILDLINMINECAINIVKFIKNEISLEFSSFK